MKITDVGILVESENIKDLTDAINKLHDDKELRKKSEVNGRLRVQKMCNWNRITKMYERIYREVKI